VTPERKFVAYWLTSAALVSAIRLLHAGSLNYDATIQIQAAQNLLAGKGLTVYWLASENLAEPLALEGLTHFSAGFSLYAAALMALGLTPAVFVKIWGFVLTMAGWLGFGRLAFAYIGDGGRQGRIWKFVALWIAFVCPLLFTSRWGGTDIVLWAATPWILMLVTRAPADAAQLELPRDVLAGLLLGLCILARYASVFLAAYVLAIVAVQCGRRLWVAAQRFAALGGGLLPGLAVQTYITFWMFGRSTPGGISLGADRLAEAGARLSSTLPTLGAANESVFFWLPATLRFWSGEGTGLPALISTGVILVLLPAALILTSRARVSPWWYDVRVVSAGLLVALPLFLWTCGLVGTYNYIADRRYYEPLRPMAVLVAYVLATTYTASRLSLVTSAVRWMGGAFLALFILLTAAELGAAVLPIDQGGVWRRAVLGADPRPWPSFGLTHESSAARDFVLDLMKEDPNAVLITTRAQWFYAEPDVDHSRVMRWELCAGSPQATHIAGPVRFLIFESERGTGSTSLRWPGNPEAIDNCWPPLPNVELVRRFPDEQLRVLRAYIPEGVRIDITRSTSSSE
jgi:hypothetical protein